MAMFTVSVLVSGAQGSRDRIAPLGVPHATGPVLLDCGSNSTASWGNVPRVTLSKGSGTIMRLDAKKPLTLEFLGSDPSAVVGGVPAAVESKLDSFHAQYAFQWDENKPYGHIEIKEKDLDSQHPKITERSFKHSPYEAAFEDIFHSSAVVEVGAPSWQRWITEMHAHVRPPDAKPMTSMFFGRTNDEEKFRTLDGQGIACPVEGGWTAKFAVAWLPFGNWRPNPGVTAALKLVAPLPHSHDGYVLVSVAPFTLTK